MESEQEAYHALQCYTLAHPDPEFIHQHVVDAFMAQRAGANTTPIGLTFALVGLYLAVEKHTTGKQVQHAHQQLAMRKQVWPAFPLPLERGSITVLDVMEQPEGTARDQLIHAWCASVWAAYLSNRPTVIDLLREGGLL